MMIGGDKTESTYSEYDGGESSCDEESYGASSRDTLSHTCGISSGSNDSSVDHVSTRPEEDITSSSSSDESDDSSAHTPLSDDDDGDKSTSRDTKSTDSSSTVTESVSPQDLHYYVVFECKPPFSLPEKNQNLSCDPGSTTSSLTVSSCSLSDYTSNDDDHEYKCDRSTAHSEKSDERNHVIDSDHKCSCEDNDFDFLLNNPTDLDILDTFTMMDLSTSGSKSAKEDMSKTGKSTSRTNVIHKRSVDQFCSVENQERCPELDEESLTEKRIHQSRPQKLRRLYSMTSTLGSSCRDFLRLLQDSNCNDTKCRMEEQSISQNSTTSLSSFSSREEGDWYDGKTSKVFF